MKFDGVNSILRLYKMIEFDFPCVSRHFCRKSPEIHIRKKMCVILKYKKETTSHAKLYIVILK